MPLNLFRSYYVDHLRANLAHNLPRYAARNPWADRPKGKKPVTLPSALEPAVPLTLLPPVGDDFKDLENSKILFDAFPNLTPLQARDPRLWTRLTHVECWNYMRKRWNIERTGDDAAKAQRFIFERYFVPRAESRALLRNGLARLWWYARLTHDPDRDDPYELTGVLLEQLDTAQQILERNMGRAQHVRTSFLDFIRLNADDLGTSSGQRRERVRRLAKMLNMYGGATLLDALSSEQVTTLLRAELSLSS